MHKSLKNILIAFKIYNNFKSNFLIIILLSIIQIFLDIFGIFLLGYLVALILNLDLSNSILNILDFVFINLNNSQIILLIIFTFLLKFILNLATYKKIFSYIKNEQKNLANLFAEKTLYLSSEKKENIKTFNYFTELLRFSTEYYLVYFLKFISEFIILISIIALLFYINYKLNLVLTLSIILFFILFVNFNKKKVISFGKNVSLNYENFLKKAKYFIYSITEIKAFKREQKFKINTLKSFNKYSDNRFNQIFFSFIPRLVAELFFVLLLIIIFLYLNINNIYDDSTISVITLFTLILIRAIPLTSACIFSLTNIWNFSYSNKLIFSYLNNFKLLKKSNKKFIKIKKINQIQVKNLTFSYKKKSIYKNLNFIIKKNEIFGIFGKSGSGKTTLGLILMGLLNPRKGSVLFEDNSKKLKPKDLDIFSYIPQEINLMEDTLYNNIKFEFGSYINKTKTIKLLKDFKLYSELKNHNTKNMSSNISGGQKQRVLICRALYNQKKVIILDEPSSYLDQKNIDILVKNLIKIKTKIFVIIISHDKNLKKICDNYVSL